MGRGEVTSSKARELRDKWQAAKIAAQNDRELAEAAYMRAQQHEAAAESYLMRLMDNLVEEP